MSKKEIQEQRAAAALAKMDLGEGTKTVNEENNKFELPHLKPCEMYCEYYDADMVQRPGMVLLYYNTNSFGSSSVYGEARTNVVDPRKIPLYLSKYKQFIRNHAVERLKIHFKDTHVSTGVTETLTAEDYSISFSFASLTEAGRALNAQGKNELPLGLATHANWVAPQPPSPGQNPVYVVNVFLQLQEPTKRGPAVLKRAREDEISRNEAAKRPKFIPNNGANYRRRQEEEEENKQLIVNTTFDATKKLFEEQQMRRGIAPNLGNFPQMQEGAAPLWPTDGRSSLPME